MPRFRPARVVEVLEERPGLQRLRVRFDDPHQPGDLAYALTDLVGPVAVGHRVVLNTTAVDLGLGTGGWHVVHWNLEHDELDTGAEGHVVKLRYTSLQSPAGSAELDHPELPSGLGGVPVVACTVHSQVGVVAATVAHRRPGTPVAYVMTDGGALPLAISDLVAALRHRRLLVGVVTAGQAFGGDLEAVSVPSALQLATAVLGAEVVVVGMGPGVVGTGGALGTSAVEAAAVLDAARALGGVPLLCVRASSADHRSRHRGVSHHSATVLRLVGGPVGVPLPAGELQADPELLGLLARHEVHDVGAVDAVAALRRADLAVTTMGRGPAADPLFFEVAAAAGVAAAVCAGPAGAGGAA